MAKVLIIDDHLEIARAVQKDLSQYNPNLFKDENVFCLEKKNDIFEVLPITEINDLNHYNSGSIPSIYQNVMRAILAFLKENQNEHILILIDDFLRKENRKVVLGSNYKYVIENLSAYIYSGLLMYLNEKNVYGLEQYPSTNSEKLSFMIYSYNSRFSKYSIALLNIYERLSESDIKYFPKEACQINNISLVEGGASDVIEAGPFPLPSSLVEKEYCRMRLPEEYKKFIKNF